MPKKGSGKGRGRPKKIIVASSVSAKENPGIRLKAPEDSAGQEASNQEDRNESRSKRKKSSLSRVTFADNLNQTRLYEENSVIQEARRDEPSAEQNPQEDEWQDFPAEPFAKFRNKMANKVTERSGQFAQNAKNLQENWLGIIYAKNNEEAPKMPRRQAEIFTKNLTKLWENIKAADPLFLFYVSGNFAQDIAKHQKEDAALDEKMATILSSVQLISAFNSKEENRIKFRSQILLNLPPSYFQDCGISYPFPFADRRKLVEQISELQEELFYELMSNLGLTRDYPSQAVQDLVDLVTSQFVSEEFDDKNYNLAVKILFAAEQKDEELFKSLFEKNGIEYGKNNLLCDKESEERERFEKDSFEWRLENNQDMFDDEKIRERGNIRMEEIKAEELRRKEAEKIKMYEHQLRYELELFGREKKEANLAQIYNNPDLGGEASQPSASLNPDSFEYRRLQKTKDPHQH